MKEVMATVEESAKSLATYDFVDAFMRQLQIVIAAQKGAGL
jgi:hypothetical protein